MRKVNGHFSADVQYRTNRGECMEKSMDRRQKKTREAIFEAFTALLSRKHFSQITVGEIIEKADIGRATFYAHFETKDFLLKELCEELFCHIFDATQEGEHTHKHIFTCDAPSSVVVHLLQHLQKNDNQILTLLACENNGLFMQYFKESLKDLIRKYPDLFGAKRVKDIPAEYWINYISSTFVETVKWWIDNGMKETPYDLSNYFYAVLYGEDNE